MLLYYKRIGLVQLMGRDAKPIWEMSHMLYNSCWESCWLTLYIILIRRKINHLASIILHPSFNQQMLNFVKFYKLHANILFMEVLMIFTHDILSNILVTALLVFSLLVVLYGESRNGCQLIDFSQPNIIVKHVHLYFVLFLMK